MSDENKDMQSWIEPDLEARVVAWVLGEASEFEAAELARIIAEKPELGIFKRRMEAVHGLVAAAARMELDPMRMAEERRRKLLERLGGEAGEEAKGVVAMPERQSDKGLNISSKVVMGIAACLIAMLLASIAVPSFSGVQSRAAYTKKLAEAKMATMVQVTPGYREPTDFTPMGNSAPLAKPRFMNPAPAQTQRLAALDSLKNLARNREDLDDESDNSRAPSGGADKFFSGSGGGAADLVEKSKDSSSLADANETRAGDITHLRYEKGRLEQEHDYAPSDAPREGHGKSWGMLAGRDGAVPQQDAQQAREQLADADVAQAATAPAGLPGNMDGRASGTRKLAKEDEGRGGAAPASTTDSKATLSGENTYTGATKIDAGTLTMGGEIANTASVAPATPPAAPSMPVDATTAAKSEPMLEEAAAAQPVEGEIPTTDAEPRKQAEAQAEEKTIAQVTEAKRFIQNQTAFAANALPAAMPAAAAAEGALQQQDAQKQAGNISQDKVLGLTGGISVANGATASSNLAFNGGQTFNGHISYGSPISRTAPGSMAASDSSGVDTLHAPTITVTAGKTTVMATRGRVSVAGIVNPPGPVALNGGGQTFGGRFNLGAKTAAGTVTLNTPVMGDIPILGRAFRSPQQQAPAIGEISASDQAYSTFSLHVSDVSFLLAKNALASGQLPDPDSTRPEEFYNAFDYGDPAPATNEKIACRIEQAAHPMLQQRNLVRIAMKVAATGRGEGQPLRLTVLLDTSGSMERDDRAASVQRAMKVLTSLLGPNDAVTLIGFARQPRLLAEEVPGNQAGKLVDIVKHTPAEGGTNMEEALKTASELALRHFAKGGQNRVVMLTDGAANLGDADPAQLSKLVERLRQQGVSFDACGVGADGFNDDVLEALTRKGGGRYYFLTRPEDADAGFARQLAGAFRPAAENVKMQVRFNPDRVGKYRLIGFEKHRLNQEDFRNDKVTAAQLAAEEAAVALYQAQVLPEGEGEIGEVFVRFRDPSNGQIIEQSWTIPYDPQAPALDKASPSMQLAATASLVAEKLRGGPIADGIDLDALAPIVGNLRGVYAQQARVRELATMFEQARRLTARK